VKCRKQSAKMPGFLGPELTRGFQTLTQNLSYSNIKNSNFFARVSLLQEDRDALGPAGFSTLESQHRATQSNW